jgi:hypothetical protein
MPEIVILDAEERWNRKAEDEWLWWPRVLWVDPGGVTGVATLWFDPKAVLEGKILAKCVLAVSEIYLSGPEDGSNGQVNRILRIRRSLDQFPGLATGCETFKVLRADPSEEYISPARIRAKLSFALSMTKPFGSDRIGAGVPLLAQSPADALTSFTPARLRALGMYTESAAQHTNDAKSHTLLHLRRIKQYGREWFEEVHGYEEGWFA